MVLRLFHWLLALAMAFAVALPTFADDDEKADGIELHFVVSGDHWIGVSLDELSPIVKSQLGLEHGIVLAEIVPNSPAEQAGLKAFDIVTKVDEKEIKSPNDLIEAVAKSNDELSFTLLRGGKGQVIKVTPQKRPVEARPHSPAEPEQVAKARKAFEETMRRWMERREHKDLELDSFGPAVVIRAERKGLPDGVKVTIEKEGNKPASITVKRGDESWEVTEEKLDKLPEELRPGVQELLAGGVHPGMNVLGLRTSRMQLPAPMTAPLPPLPPSVAEVAPKSTETEQQTMKRVEEQLKEVAKRLEELKAQIEKK